MRRRSARTLGREASPSASSPVEAMRARRRLDQAQHQAAERALAAAGLADEAERLARRAASKETPSTARTVRRAARRAARDRRRRSCDDRRPRAAALTPHAPRMRSCRPRHALQARASASSAPVTGGIGASSGGRASAVVAAAAEEAARLEGAARRAAAPGWAAGPRSATSSVPAGVSRCGIERNSDTV